MNEIKVQVLFSGVLNEKQLAMEIMGALRIADPECITAIAPINEWDDYWKKRCLAAELNISTYSDWHGADCGKDENLHLYFVKWEEAFKEWQKLKSNPPSK